MFSANLNATDLDFYSPGEDRNRKMRHGVSSKFIKNITIDNSTGVLTIYDEELDEELL